MKFCYSFVVFVIYVDVIEKLFCNKNTRLHWGHDKECHFMKAFDDLYAKLHIQSYSTYFLCYFEFIFGMRSVLKNKRT